MAKLSACEQITTDSSCPTFVASGLLNSKPRARLSSRTIVFQVFIPAKLAFQGEIERSLLFFVIQPPPSARHTKVAAHAATTNIQAAQPLGSIEADTFANPTAVAGDPLKDINEPKRALISNRKGFLIAVLAESFVELAQRDLFHRLNCR
jgi:hypothetical protein